LGAIDDAVERLGAAELLQVLALGLLPVAVGRQKHDEVPSRLHDLVKGLLLGDAEEDADLALGRAPPDIAEAVLGTISETNPDILNLVDHAALDDVAEDPCVLADALGRFKYGFNG